MGSHRSVRGLALGLTSAAETGRYKAVPALVPLDQLHVSHLIVRGMVVRPSLGTAAHCTPVLFLPFAQVLPNGPFPIQLCDFEVFGTPTFFVSRPLSLLAT